MVRQAILGQHFWAEHVINNLAFPWLLGHAEAQDRMPVVLLSGFLGSGKTTLVNALLRDPRLFGTAVAINEFGAVPLDHELIDHGADQTVVLANGCLCCNLSGDMEQAVMRLFSRRDAQALPGFARLIIEPSGLSDPAPIAQAILRSPMMARVLRLEAIVTTVDAVFALRQLQRHGEMRKQIVLADQLVVTKPDLVDAAALAHLQAVLRDLNPMAPIRVVRDGGVDAGELLPESFLDLEAPASRRSLLHADTPAEPDHLAQVRAVSLHAQAPLDWRAFDLWLRGIRTAHAERLLRVKGMLQVSGVAGPVVVQGVHHVLHAPVELPAWPGAERASRLVLIAEAAVCDEIAASWHTALPRLIAA